MGDFRVQLVEQPALFDARDEAACLGDQIREIQCAAGELAARHIRRDRTHHDMEGDAAMECIERAELFLRRLEQWGQILYRCADFGMEKGRFLLEVVMGCLTRPPRTRRHRTSNGTPARRLSRPRSLQTLFWRLRPSCLSSAQEISRIA